MRPYGYHPSNPKIDIVVNGVYVGSTNWARTCREAREKYLEQNPDAIDVKAYKVK